MCFRTHKGGKNRDQKLNLYGERTLFPSEQEAGPRESPVVHLSPAVAFGDFQYGDGDPGGWFDHGTGFLKPPVRPSPAQWSPSRGDNA